MRMTKRDGATIFSNSNPPPNDTYDSNSRYSFQFTSGTAIRSEDNDISTATHNHDSHPVVTSNPVVVSPKMSKLRIDSGPSILILRDDKEESSEPWEEIELGKVTQISDSINHPAETVLIRKSSERRWLTGIFIVIILCLLIFGWLFGLIFAGLQR
jgi:hypothetical protein